MLTLIYVSYFGIEGYRKGDGMKDLSFKELLQCKPKRKRFRGDAVKIGRDAKKWADDHKDDPNKQIMTIGPAMRTGSMSDYYCDVSYIQASE